MKKYLAFLAVMALTLVGCNMEQKSNKDKAMEVLKSLETGDKTAVTKWINPDKYIQHNLNFPSGRDALLKALDQLKKDNVKVNIKRVIVDGDFVALHTDYNLSGPKVGFDIFRFENDKIVEHWDNLQENPGKNPSGHTMLDGNTEIIDMNKTEANKTLVKDLVETVLVEGKFDKLPDYYDDDKYIQHNPFIGDTVSAVKKAFEEMAKKGNGVKFDKIHMVLGEGNFVLVASEGTFGTKPTSFYDLFRVENGKVAEHWDVLETIPPLKEWNNTNGKF